MNVPRRTRLAVAAALALVILVAIPLVRLSRRHGDGVRLRSSSAPPTTALSASTPTSTTSVTPGPAGTTKTCVASDQEPPRGDVLGVDTADGVEEIGLGRGERFRIAGPTGSHLNPSWSLDGRHVAFELRLENGEPQATIGIADIASHCWTGWPLGTDRFRLPSLSNDGSRVAYQRVPPGTTISGWRAELADADGTNARSLNDPRARVTWAPDTSGRFAVCDSDGLKVVDTTGRTILLQKVSGAEFPAWSPDATRVAYSVSTQAGVYVAKADGGGSRKLVEGSGMVFFMSWSPGGDMIAYERRGQLWVVDADGSNARQIPGPVDVVETPRWASDGRSIVYTTGDYGPTTPRRVMAVDADGGTPRLVADNATLVTLFQRS